MQISNFKLEADEYAKIKQILQSLSQRSRIEAIILINRNGQEIAREGNASMMDVVALSSLAASNLAATFGLAKLIGEEEVSRVYLRGQRFSILISPAGNQALLLLVIEVRNEPQLDVRNVRQAALVLEDILSKCSQRVEVIDEV